MPSLVIDIVSWPTLGTALLIFGFAPGLALRLIILAFPRDDPRRRELLGELYQVPWIERPFWVVGKLELALTEGLWGRLHKAIGSRRRTMEAAERVLALAQQTADQAIADARRECDEVLGRARREADWLLTRSRGQSEQITSDARARAEALERDVQERYKLAVLDLIPQREELERRIDDLRAFEREYRSRLLAVTEGSTEPAS
jgi:hypothetical protein